MRSQNEPLVIVKKVVSLEEALSVSGCNVLIVDTAGRLQIDEELWMSWFS